MTGPWRKFEHKVTVGGNSLLDGARVKRDLDASGEEGWELVQVILTQTGMIMFWKRERFAAMADGGGQGSDQEQTPVG